MIVEPASARIFIARYRSLLTEAHRLAFGQPSSDILKVLAFGREAIRSAPDLVPRAIVSVEERGVRLSAAFLHAVESLRVTQWIYLKDATKYSIFVDAAGSEAYAVVGLTGPIRSILGGDAVTFRAGVVEYCGKYVCDGILENHMWLGPGFKRDFNTKLAALKKEGRFHVTCEP